MAVPQYILGESYARLACYYPALRFARHFSFNSSGRRVFQTGRISVPATDGQIEKIQPLQGRGQPELCETHRLNYTAVRVSGDHSEEVKLRAGLCGNRKTDLGVGARAQSGKFLPVAFDTKAFVGKIINNEAREHVLFGASVFWENSNSHSRRIKVLTPSGKFFTKAKVNKQTALPLFVNCFFEDQKQAAERNQDGDNRYVNCGLQVPPRPSKVLASISGVTGLVKPESKNA